MQVHDGFRSFSLTQWCKDYLWGIVFSTVTRIASTKYGSTKPGFRRIDEEGKMCALLEELQHFERGQDGTEKPCGRKKSIQILQHTDRHTVQSYNVY